MANTFGPKIYYSIHYTPVNHVMHISKVPLVAADEYQHKELEFETLPICILCNGKHTFSYGEDGEINPLVT